MPKTDAPVEKKEAGALFPHASGVQGIRSEDNTLES